MTRSVLRMADNSHRIIDTTTGTTLISPVLPESPWEQVRDPVTGNLAETILDSVYTSMLTAATSDDLTAIAAATVLRTRTA